uniref:Uncharacterized protein n=1 Tax=Gracilaria salicornia TaxID=172968 RepID=W8DUG5_9FLOR|nr:hypothetical protein [Gracilaria salicornia]AHG53102.1 hypothetical protein [Gracilaria salicornia]AMR57152.1 hypothetical protein [Gracilaria salicornia]UAD89814.1 hypothetical protein [Gracilaria salicornia]
MNQFRLSNQFNFIDMFDSLDNTLSKNKNFFVLNILNYFQVFCKLKKISRISSANYLFLECLVSQKTLLLNNKSRKKQNSVFLKVTIRNIKKFLFLEVLLHTVFLIHQPVIKWYKIKIEFLDLLWPPLVLDKLLLNTPLWDNFMICAK